MRPFNLFQRRLKNSQSGQEMIFYLDRTEDIYKILEMYAQIEAISLEIIRNNHTVEKDFDNFF